MNKIVIKKVTFVSLFVIFVIFWLIYFRYYKPVYNEWFFSLSEKDNRVAVLRMVSRTGSKDYHYEIWTYRTNGFDKRKICQIPQDYDPDQASPKLLFWIDNHIMMIARNKDGLRTLLRIVPETGKITQWSHGPVDEKIIMTNKFGALTARQLEYNFYYILFRKFGENDFRKFGVIRSGDILNKGALSQDSFHSTVVESYTNAASPTEINSMITFIRPREENNNVRQEGYAINDVMLSYPLYPDNERMLTFIANKGFYTLKPGKTKNPLVLYKIPGQFRVYYAFDKARQAAYIPSVKNGCINRVDLLSNKIYTFNTGVKIITPIESSSDGTSLFFLTTDDSRNFRLCRFNLVDNTLKYLTPRSEFEGRHVGDEKILRLISERSEGRKSFEETNPDGVKGLIPENDSPSQSSTKTDNI